VKACAYRRSGLGRERVPANFRCSLEGKGFFGLVGGRTLVMSDQEIAMINSLMSGSAGHPSAPFAYGYLVSTNNSKCFVVRRVPTGFRLKSP
jgi:hypothetical protein